MAAPPAQEEKKNEKPADGLKPNEGDKGKDNDKAKPPTQPPAKPTGPGANTGAKGPSVNARINVQCIKQRIFTIKQTAKQLFKARLNFDHFQMMMLFIAVCLHKLSTNFHISKFSVYAIVLLV